MLKAEQLQQLLKQHQDPEKAKVLQRFFKTGPGEYGEGDIFLGIKVPELRKIAKSYKTLALPELQILLNSPVHDERFIALVILIEQYKSFKDENKQKEHYQFYTNNFKCINNWDLVDCSAPNIVGHYLFDKDRKILCTWADSSHLWTRRIAMLSTFYFIRKNDVLDSLQLSRQLLNDKEDLIHKAVGWMLREAAKREFELVNNFLAQHYSAMPRTMLRYAIERFPEPLRQSYLKG